MKKNHGNNMHEMIVKGMNAIKYERWEEALGLLNEYKGKDPVADYLIGLIYYCRFNNLELAKVHFSRVFSSEKLGLDEYKARSAEFLGHINWEQNRMHEAEENMLKAVAYGNPDCFLEAAFLLFFHHRKDKKDLAISFAREGELALADEEDLIIKASGFHIVASVYLWVNLITDANRVQKHFLNNLGWKESYPHQLEKYLYLLLAKSKKEFIEETFNTFYLKKTHKDLYDAYLCKYNMKDMPIRNKKRTEGIITRIENAQIDYE